MPDFNCSICGRSFLSEKGLVTHERQHSAEKNNNKLFDEKYVAKRIANTKSVQLHRQMNPKIRFEDLAEDTKQAIKEAKLLEKFLKEQLGLNVSSYEDKLKFYGEINEIEDEELYENIETNQNNN